MCTTSGSFHDHTGRSLALAQGESDVDVPRRRATVDNERCRGRASFGNAFADSWTIVKFNSEVLRVWVSKLRTWAVALEPDCRLLDQAMFKSDHSYFLEVSLVEHQDASS